MSDVVENEDLEVVVEFHPNDATAAEDLKKRFADEEVFESEAFTGTQALSLIVSATKKALVPVLEFFAAHRKSYKDATVKIGRNEISLKGYTIEEVKGLFESPMLQKLLKEIKKT